MYGIYRLWGDTRVYNGSKVSVLATERKKGHLKVTNCVHKSPQRYSEAGMVNNDDQEKSSSFATSMSGVFGTSGFIGHII